MSFHILKKGNYAWLELFTCATLLSASRSRELFLNQLRADLCEFRPLIRKKGEGYWLIIDRISYLNIFVNKDNRY